MIRFRVAEIVAAGADSNPCRDTGRIAVAVAVAVAADAGALGGRWDGSGMGTFIAARLSVTN